MDRLGKLIPIAIASVALLLVVLQHLSIARLEKKIDALDEATAEAPTPEPPKVSKPDTKRLDQIETQLEHLSKKVSRIRTDLASGGARKKKAAPARTAAAAQPPVGDEVVSLREDVDALLQGEALDTPEGQDKVRDLVKKAREEAEQERRQRREKFGKEMRAEWLQEFTENAGLSEDQAGKVQAVLDRQSQQWRTLRDSMRKGETSFSEMRKQMETARAGSDEELREVLDDDQFEKYQETRWDRGPFGRGRPRRPPPR
jgi:hypothetical protein